jgi:hypothetical protein
MVVLQKEEKTLIYFAAFIIGAVILINILKRYQMRKQESNYVMPRGFFPQTSVPSVVPTPPPAPPVTPPIAGRSLPGHSGPPTPYPYPYPYPYPVYDFSVQPYVMVAPEVSKKAGCYKSIKIAGEDKETCFQTKADYVKFLKRSYNTFVDSYKDALYTLRLGKAAKIASALRKIKSDIESEVGIGLF